MMSLFFLASAPKPRLDAISVSQALHIIILHSKWENKIKQGPQSQGARCPEGKAKSGGRRRG